MTLFNDPKKVHHITISTFLSFDLGLFATTFREYNRRCLRFILSYDCFLCLTTGPT